MAFRRALSRDPWDRIAAEPLPPPRPDPRLFPTDRHPRWRLRVFDRCWPWRATRGEVIADAVSSRHARRDTEDRMVYLDCCAQVQRDPPGAPWRPVP